MSTEINHKDQRGVRCAAYYSGRGQRFSIQIEVIVDDRTLTLKFRLLSARFTSERL
jgi:hypothetical protein